MSGGQAHEPAEAVCVVEVDSIARGVVTLDALAKRAEVTVHWARPVTPGKYILLFAGSVASAEEAFDAAKERAGDLLIDELFLPFAHAALMPALKGRLSIDPGDAIGVVETSSVASIVQAADVALKMAEVAVLKMHLAVGIGGKGYFHIAGQLDSVEAALEGARDALDAERIVGIELIPQPHPEVRGFLSH